MSRYPPLTDEELRQLYQRNPCEESRRLLWEIARLQDLMGDLALFVATVNPAMVDNGRRTQHEDLLARTVREPSLSRARERQVQRSKPDGRPTVLGCQMVEPFIGPPEEWQVQARKMGESRNKRRRW